MYLSGGPNASYWSILSLIGAIGIICFSLTCVQICTMRWSMCVCRAEDECLGEAPLRVSGLVFQPGVVGVRDLAFVNSVILRPGPWSACRLLTVSFGCLEKLELRGKLQRGSMWFASGVIVYSRTSFVADDRHLYRDQGYKSRYTNQ